MMRSFKPNQRKISPYLIWSIGVSFVLFQFFLQLSTGVVLKAIMEELHLTALVTGLLGSAFYYIYTALQIPVGLLLDRYNARYLLSTAALACSMGCLFFANSHHLSFLFIGRLLIGAGSAFAFVGLSHLLRQHFSLRDFAFIIGLSETLGFLVTVFGIVGLGWLVHHAGWRIFISYATLTGALIAGLIWWFIPNEEPASKVNNSPLVLLKKVAKIGPMWSTGVFVGLAFSLITVYAAMWAVPFIQMKLHCDLTTSSAVDAMIFLGAAVSCPLFGIINNYFPHRKPWMMASCFVTAILFLIALFAPITTPFLFGMLMFLTGISCGCYMLAYTIANELSPRDALSTSTGFVNTLAVVSAPILQPFVGFLLDWHSQGNAPKLIDFQMALLVVPICLFAAGLLVLGLPEKQQNTDFRERNNDYEPA